MLIHYFVLIYLKQRNRKKEICKETETYVHSVSLTGIPIARYILQDIKKETASDAILSKVIRFVKNDWQENN